MVHSKARLAVAVIATALATGGFVAAGSLAGGGPGGGFVPGSTVGPGDHVPICHATGNGGYVRIAPTAGNVFGHAGASHQSGKDIIPPFVYVQKKGDANTSLSAGQNWSTGQATWENGCVAPSSSTSTTNETTTGQTTTGQTTTSSDCSGEGAVTTEDLTVSGSQATERFTVTGGRVTVTLASYDASHGNGAIDQQVLYRYVTSTLCPGTYTLTVDLPDCAYQVDFVYGQVLTLPEYGESKIASLVGGSGTCSSTTTTTTTETTTTQRTTTAHTTTAVTTTTEATTTEGTTTAATTTAATTTEGTTTSEAGTTTTATTAPFTPPKQPAVKPAKRPAVKPARQHAPAAAKAPYAPPKQHPQTPTGGLAYTP